MDFFRFLKILYSRKKVKFVIFYLKCLEKSLKSTNFYFLKYVQRKI